MVYGITRDSNLYTVYTVFKIHTKAVSVLARDGYLLNITGFFHTPARAEDAVSRSFCYILKTVYVKIIPATTV